jgi:hypothetical protein
MGGAVTIKRFSSIEEALTAQSFLRAHGIYAALDCGFHAQNDWVMQPALSGLGLLVSPVHTDKAADVLAIEAHEAETFLTTHWGDLQPETMNNRIFRKRSFIALYLIHPLAIIIYLMLAGLITVLENKRRNDRQKDPEP